MSEATSRPEPALLWPREHGAYGQVLLPLTTALLSGPPSPAAFLLALGAAAVFLGHEALLVLLGQRGPRLRERRSPAARRTLTRITPVALLAGATGLWLAPPDARWTAAAVVPLGALLAALVISGREKTTLGELVAASTAAAAAAPVAVAAGVAPPVAAIAWLVWTLAFGAATGGVRWLLSRHKGKPDPAAPALLVVSTALVLVGAWRLPVLLAALPQTLVAWALVLGRPHPRHLKRVGWTLMVASLLTAAALLLTTG